MPYIANDRREHLDSGGRVTTTGDLTYLLTKALIEYSDDDRLSSSIVAAVEGYRDERPDSFTIFCDVMGALICAGCEFDRRAPTSLWASDALDVLQRYTENFYLRVVAPYEDEKIAQNGDLFA